MLTPDQITELRENGVLLLKNALPEEDVRAWREAWAALKADIAAGVGPLTRADRFVVGELPAPLGEAWRHPRLVEVAADIVGPDVALYFNRLLVKDEQWNGAVGAHQDMPYFHGVQDKLAMFVPLEPFNAASGGVSFVAGSNKFGNLGVRGVIDHTKHPELPVVTPEAEPGDVVAMDFLVWHFSEAAPEPRERPVLQIAYQNAACGSYYGAPDRPTLVSGRWCTEHFSRFGDWITPDGAPPK